MPAIAVAVAKTLELSNPIAPLLAPGVAGRIGQGADIRHGWRRLTPANGAAAAALVLLLVLAWLGQVLALRQGVAQQASVNNQAAADRLGAALARDMPARHQAAARLAQLRVLDVGAALTWVDTQGEPLAQSPAEQAEFPAPAWFMRLAPITPAEGLALVPLDDAHAGANSALRVRLSMAPTWRGLWRAAQVQALLLGLLGAVTFGAAALARGRQQRRLAALTAQLRGLRHGSMPLTRLPADDAMQPLALAVQAVAEQRCALIAAHTEQMEALRRHAHADALTGLPNRRMFIARLGQALADGAGPGGVGLLLLRLRDLYGMNLRQGHARTDEMLQAVAELLRSYPRQAKGCHLGRLNGSDFALLLPLAGQAQATAQSLLAALRPVLSPLDAAAGVAIGAVELQRPAQAAAALALADEALARAEVNGRFALELVDATNTFAQLWPKAQAGGGQASWLANIQSALNDGRLRLDEQPVRSADGNLLYLDCGLQMQLHADGVFEPTARWFALAARTRLTAAVEQRAAALALGLIAEDGVPRGVAVSGASLVTPGFIEQLSTELSRQPSTACRLWITVSEATAHDHAPLLREAASRWRAAGAMLAMGQAGHRLARTPRLLDLGLDCVRVDARYVDGVGAADDTAARRYLRALVRLVQGVGLQISAEGVATDADLAMLWRIGFDAAAGPALSADDGVDLALDLAPGPALGQSEASATSDSQSLRAENHETLV